MEVNPEPTEPTEIPLGMEPPIWMLKFGAWSNLQKNCPAKRGPAGIYCAWEGRNCSYTGCPRRIFEEMIIDIDKIPAPNPQPPKLKNRISVLEQENTKLIKRIEELEKNAITA